MNTTIAKIESARNEAFKAMTFNEVEAALSAHMTGAKLKDVYTASDIRELNTDAVIGNQLIIEYSLHINDLRSAAEAAADVAETLAS